MTRPASGEGPAEGPSGASASAGRHAVPDAADVAAGAGRRAVERALRERSPGRRYRATALVTDSDLAGQWNGIGPGALLLPAANGRARAAEANGHHPATDLPATDLPATDLPATDLRPTSDPAGPTQVNGHFADHADGPAPERRPAIRTVPPAAPGTIRGASYPADGWPPAADAAGPEWGAEGDPAGPPDEPADWRDDLADLHAVPVDWRDDPVDTRGGPAVWPPGGVDGPAGGVDGPAVWPAGPVDWEPAGGVDGPAVWPAGPVDWEPPRGVDERAVWPAGPVDWEPPGRVDGPAAWPAGPVDWEPPRGVDERAVGGWPTGWHSPPPVAPNGVRPAGPPRIGDLPPPVENGRLTRPNGRPPTAPPPYPGPPYPAPPVPTAYPLGDRPTPVFDDDATRLLRRYVPAQEMLDREGREPAPARSPTPPKHPPRAVVRRRRTRRRRLEWPFLIVFALLSAYLIRAYVVQTFYIPSGSMHETLLEGDRVLVNKLSYHVHDVHRGDVVVFRRPPDFPVEDEDLIKRVVALPGETVESRGRQLYVDGKRLTEPYLDPLCRGTQDFPPVTVPAGDLWVMGDNRCNSSDSRVFGPISENLLVGRAFVLAWPFARLSWL